MPLLYVAAMGVLLGGFVDGDAGHALEGATTYLAFIAPGLLAAHRDADGDRRDRPTR